MHDEAHGAPAADARASGPGDPPAGEASLPPGAIEDPREVKVLHLAMLGEPA